MDFGVRNGAFGVLKGWQVLAGLTFAPHAAGQALLVAAVLAAVALPFVHHAVAVIPAAVAQILPDRPLKETLTALAAVHPVVLPCGGQRSEVSGGVT